MARVLKIVGLTPFAVMALFCLYGLTRAISEGLAGGAIGVLVVLLLLAGAAWLLWRRPALGVLLVVPIAFPLGLFAAAVSLTTADPLSVQLGTFALLCFWPAVGGVLLACAWLITRSPEEREAPDLSPSP